MPLRHYSSLDKLFFCKPYVFTAEDNEKHSPDRFYSNIGYQKDLQKNWTFSNLFQNKKLIMIIPKLFKENFLII